MSWVAAASIVIALAWAPMFVRFYRAWRRRSNPLSLAICGLVGLMIYSNAGIVLFAKGDERQVLLVLRGLNLLVLLNFYVAAYWSDRRYHGDRAGDTDQPQGEE